MCIFYHYHCKVQRLLNRFNAYTLQRMVGRYLGRCLPYGHIPRRKNLQTRSSLKLLISSPSRSRLRFTPMRLFQHEGKWIHLVLTAQNLALSTYHTVSHIRKLHYLSSNARCSSIVPTRLRKLMQTCTSPLQNVCSSASYSWSLQCRICVVYYTQVDVASVLAFAIQEAQLDSISETLAQK
jgi:hypothetical protein